MTFVTAAVAAVLVVLLVVILVVLRSVHCYFVATELELGRRRSPWRGVEMMRGYSFFLSRGILISVLLLTSR